MRQTILSVSTGLALVFLALGSAVNARAAAIGPNGISRLASTVPSDGDQNPYGVAIVPRTTGKLVAGHVLVSNFNDGGLNGGRQGTGTTIVDISPNGGVALFAQIRAANLPGSCPGGVGLTTALAVLQAGWVIVGSLPTADGSSATAQAGCLIVLDSRGRVVETLSGGSINGPWDMTVLDLGYAAVLFVTNVLNGTVSAGVGVLPAVASSSTNPGVVNGGTVVRILLSTPFTDGDGDDFPIPHELARNVIASGFGERTDPAALVIGPTGVGLGRDGTLYVADTLGNQIVKIANALFRLDSAGTGVVVSAGGSLNGPLGLAVAPNGNILTTNGGDGNLVETTPGGTQVAAQMIDATGIGGGTLFGLAVIPATSGIYFVNDGNNTLNLLH